MGLVNQLLGEQTPAPRLSIEERLKLEQNDLDNAARILAVHGENLLYVAGKGWSVWDGSRYSFRSGELAAHEVAASLRDLVIEEAKAVWTTEIDEVTLQRTLERELAKPKPAFADHDGARKLLRNIKSMALNKHATKCGNVSKYETALRACRHQVRADITSLDQNPWSFVVPNGVIDLKRVIETDFPEASTSEEKTEIKRGWLREVDRAERPTKSGGVPFDPSAPCPEWEALIELTLPNPEVRACFKRAMGMLLFGRNDAQVALLLRGGGGNGKSTVVQQIAHVLGEDDGYAAPCKIEMFLVTHNQSAGQATPEEVDLPGARAYIASEPAATDELSAKKIKALTGGDARPARALGMPQFIYRPSGVPILSFNRTPRIKDEDEGTRRRLVFFPFDVNLRALPKEKQRDPSEVAEALGREASGILNWMIEGFVEYKAYGLDIPAVMGDLKSALMEASDPVGEFIKDCCVKDGDGLINVKEMYRVYQEWCERTSSTEFKSRGYAGLMLEKGYRRKKTNGGYWHYEGLKWSGGVEMNSLLSASGYERRASSSAPATEGDMEPPPF